MQANTPTETCEVCRDPATVHIHLARDRKWTEVHHLCEQHVDDMLGRYFPADSVAPNVERPLSTVTLFDLELLVVRSDGPRDGVYYLREHGGSRHFSATMDYCQSAALYWNGQPSANSRPGTHAAFADAIAALGCTLQDVLIYGFTETESHFHALLRIQQGDQLAEANARPSDAINLAMICDVPIFVSEEAWHTYMSGGTGET